MNMKDSWREENSSQQVKKQMVVRCLACRTAKDEVQNESVKSNRKDFESV